MESNPIAQAIKKLLASQEERMKLNRDKFLERENYEAIGELEIHINTLKYLLHNIQGDTSDSTPVPKHREKIDEYIALTLGGSKKPEPKTHSHNVKLGDVISLSDSRTGMNKRLRFASKEFNQNDYSGLAYYFEELD